VKRLRADDSAATSVKVGHRQAIYPETPRLLQKPGRFALRERFSNAHSDMALPTIVYTLKRFFIFCLYVKIDRKIGLA